MSLQGNIQSIGQIAIAVSNVEQSLVFYRDKLGLKLLFDVPANLAFLECGGIRLMQTTQQGESIDYRTSVIYYKVDNLDEAVVMVKKKRNRIYSRATANG